MSWKVKDSDGILIVDGDRTVAIIHSGDEDDARLIAASPEMLEVLKKARDANEELHSLVTNAKERMISIEALCAMQKVIRKAEGSDALKDEQKQEREQLKAKQKS